MLLLLNPKTVKTIVKNFRMFRHLTDGMIHIDKITNGTQRHRKAHQRPTYRYFDAEKWSDDIPNQKWKDA